MDKEIKDGLITGFITLFFGFLLNRMENIYQKMSKKGKKGKKEKNKHGKSI
jgi:hypothetical protein